MRSINDRTVIKAKPSFTNQKYNIYFFSLMNQMNEINISETGIQIRLYLIKEKIVIMYNYYLPFVLKSKPSSKNSNWDSKS